MDNGYKSQQKKMVKKLEETFANVSNGPSFVEMQQDYENDDKICLTSIVFTPDEISKEIISKVINRLKPFAPEDYFYNENTLHLTIKNIKTISKPPLFTAEDVLKVDELFKRVISNFDSFEFELEDLLLFPTSVCIMAYSNDTLQKLVFSLDKGLKEIGIPDNKKYLSDSIFWGNITICRFTKQPSKEFIEEIKKFRNIKIGKLKVKEINLVTCNAACYPNSIEIINSYKLK
ncbi:MAG: hypothetical protein WC070_03875 [Candidatus Magasanikbacteria bacterium]